MVLISQLSTLVLSYLPLPTLQLLNDNGYVNGNNFDIVFNKNKNSILSTFDQFCRLRMLYGAAGYNGQLYIPVYACLFHCIKDNNLDLFNYYLIRFFSYRFGRTLYAISWTAGSISLLLVINFLFDKYDSSNMFKANFTNFINNGAEGKRALDDYNEFIQIRSHDAFSLIEPKLLTNNQDFPDINSIHIVSDLDILSIAKVNDAKTMIDLVKSKYPISINRDKYISYLDILLNNNIDLTLFNMDPNDDNNDISLLTTLAVSVLNSKVLNAISALIPNINEFYDRSEEGLLFSEVLYDLSIYYNWNNRELEISIYLSNNATIFADDLSKIDNIYRKIKSGNVYTYLYDAETALRLSGLINTKPYLDPVTEFDKELMLKFGL